MIGNDLAGRLTVTTPTTDDSGATLPATVRWVSQVDLPWMSCRSQVSSSSTVVDAEGRTLRPFREGDRQVVSTLELVAGYWTVVAGSVR